MAKKFIRITHRPSGIKLAEGPVGWGITPFEGNLYISRKYHVDQRVQAQFYTGILSLQVPFCLVGSKI